MTSQITLLAAQGNDEVLNLPPLELRESHSLGAIRHVVWGERQVPVERIESIRISPRLSEVLYRLKGGESVIVTARANVKRPSNVDGVLFRGSQGSRWQSHRLLDELRARLDSADGSAVAKEIAASWADQVNFRAERVGSDGAASGGLRPPQLGGLHAIGSHWSLHHQPATVVMPTGTGKTETMLASLTAYRPDVVLVVVPSEVLRDQTVNKVATLGLLRKLRVLGDEARNPVVGIIRRRPKSLEDSPPVR